MEKKRLDKANVTYDGVVVKNLHSKVSILEIKLHLSTDLEFVYYLFILNGSAQP